MDTPADEPDEEIEITPEMIAAAVAVLESSPFFDLGPGITEDLATKILTRGLSAYLRGIGASARSIR